MSDIKRLSETSWYMTGDSVSLSDIEGKEVTILRYVKIQTRYGDAVIMRVSEDGIEYNVITSSTRVMRALEHNQEYPTIAVFVKEDGKWKIK